MKKILGLDLGTTSIGWALVNESENNDEKSSIIKLGVRVNPLTSDEILNFEKGKSITTNADRTLKRGARRSLQRYKLRRENLKELLKDKGFITNDTIFSEIGNATTFQTLQLRSKAASKEISLEEFARVLMMINKKRGYKSNRRAQTDDTGTLIDGMEVAKYIYENDLTPGQYVYDLLLNGKKFVPDFYRSDLMKEFERIAETQISFYPELITEDLKKQITGRKKDEVWAICAKYFKERGFELESSKRTKKGEEQKKEDYSIRAKAVNQKIEPEQFVTTIQKINTELNSSSGYLGAISDRSKELYFNKQTVGEYIIEQLDKNPNYSLKNKVFYRQDYLDEFEKIWETQATFHKELTDELKKEIRDIVIFYQRPLKSQKGLVSFCELENKKIEVEINGEKKTKTIGLRVCPKSSPLFQEFKTRQILNDTRLIEKSTGRERELTQEEKDILAAELDIKSKLSASEALKLLFKNYNEFDLNRKELEGNRTQSALFEAYSKIIVQSGHGEHDFSKLTAEKIIDIVTNVFNALGFNTDILKFDSSLEGKEFENQPAYQLWHLLYSFEGDNSKTGNEKLIDKISKIYGFDKEYAKIIASVNFQQDYGNLCTKAMRKILPFMKEGSQYSDACIFAGYRHSKKSLTKEELDNKVYKDKLELLPRNSLRNPVVEKILNQMVNVVNQTIETYGKPDEIRIELARDLKKSAKEREEATNSIAKANKEHEAYKEILHKEFGIVNVTRNDIIRYKLYLELKNNGFKTLYTDTYIAPEKIFSKEFDIEHIIPQSKLFDDSFSNKTLELRRVNIEKSNSTAYDYVYSKSGEKGIEEYQKRVEKLYKDKSISDTKRKKLFMKDADIPSGFIERDLRDSQYIAKKAREILEDLVKFVVPTTGSITDKLREDWQLVDVMQELNFNKYDKIGLTEIYEDKDGNKKRRIKDWTKRNDHRHHAMDALTIAFTKRSIIEYLNNMNARSNKSSVIYKIEQKELSRDKHNKLRFNPPMPLDEFRAEAKRHLENILVSIKAKNKVVTHNTNKTKGSKGAINCKKQLTPRGQLHAETVYGSIKQYVTKNEKPGAAFNVEKINTVSKPYYRELLLKRLEQFDNDPKKAFTGKNSLDKNPIYLDEQHSKTMPDTVQTVKFETVYTIRKPISKDLKIDKVIDPKIREILTNRLKEYENNATKAFSNLDENPIWINKEKGISIKRVTITGVNNPIAIHNKLDINGNIIFDNGGLPMPNDFVNTSNNHHVAIFCDENGNLQENIVSFFEAVALANNHQSIIDKEYKKSEGWQFLFTMKQNEYFVFPNPKTGFDPKDIDLMNPDNFALISPNLFRVQKMATKDYFFRHHLETNVEEKNQLKDITWKRCGLSGLQNIIKVRINHIGQIVSVGEY